MISDRYSAVLGVALFLLVGCGSEPGSARNVSSRVHNPVALSVHTLKADDLSDPFSVNSVFDFLSKDEVGRPAFAKVGTTFELVQRGSDGPFVVVHLMTGASLVDIQALEAGLRSLHGISSVIEATSDPCVDHSGCVGHVG